MNETLLTNDPARQVECSNCGCKASVGELMEHEAICQHCGSALCAFCGCTDECGCVHPDFPDGDYVCEWVAPGVCSFCHFRIAEEQFLLATGQGITTHQSPIEVPAGLL